VNCAVCGQECRKPFRVPTAELAPDLDGRPGEPAWSTLRHWVQSCRHCGACGPDLSTLPAIAAEIVQQPLYQTEKSPFLRWATIAEAAGLRAEWGEALLQAAWMAEDAGGDATDLRRRAASRWTGDPLRLVDILRRAGAFEAALAVVDGVERPDEEARAILAFQRARIEAGDTGRHLISSALRPPARTPHVTHGKKPARGLFGRWFGR
jgi:hypothetical protein